MAGSTLWLFYQNRFTLDDLHHQCTDAGAALVVLRRSSAMTAALEALKSAYWCCIEEDIEKWQLRYLTYIQELENLLGVSELFRFDPNEEYLEQGGADDDDVLQ